MGDPTLRQDPICPPSGLTATTAANGVTLNWTPGFDPVLGYNVYLASDLAGPFTRLNDSLIEATNYTDVEPPGTYYYMVRGVRVETNPSGSYYNASEGVFASANVTVQSTPITLGIVLQPAGFTLNWNTLPGATYRVLASSSLTPPNWVDLTGPILATGSTATWSGPIGGGTPMYYFEIASP
jgi:hypothetical protein